MLVDRET
jgi:hypothetical protein